jgi:hypothetical protein
VKKKNDRRLTIWLCVAAGWSRRKERMEEKRRHKGEEEEGQGQLLQEEEGQGQL